MGRIQQCARDVLSIANKTEDFAQAEKRIEQLFFVSKAQHRGHFRGREFAGKIVNIAPIIRPGHIKSPESRNLTDFNVTEILIDLADPGPLVEGMKVDVYFQAGSDAQ